MVGRFQVMALLQAARAHVLGYALDEAKSFGLDRAIFYAAAKRGFKRAQAKTPPPAEGHRHEEQYGGKTLDTESLGDEKAYCVRVDGRRVFVIGGDLLETDDFDRQVAARFSQAYEQAWHEALQVVKGFDRSTLESQRHFYETVYKPNRDELARKWTAMAREQG